MRTSVQTLEHRAPSATSIGSSPAFHSVVIDVLREAMAAAQTTPYRVQKTTGLSPARIYRWFRLEYPIGIDELVLVSAALGVDFLDVVAEAKRRYDETAR